tara:strand:- start:9490 stop:9735 length:246 start_codon:yes stop_codon:yes gene_type:complete
MRTRVRALKVISGGDSLIGKPVKEMVGSGFTLKPAPSWENWIGADKVDMMAIRYLVRAKCAENDAAWLKVELFSLPATGGR